MIKTKKYSDLAVKKRRAERGIGEGEKKNPPHMGAVLPNRNKKERTEILRLKQKRGKGP